MGKLDYFLVSESVSIDQRTNRVSIFNVLDEFAADQFPTVIPQTVVTTAWDFEARDMDVDYQVNVCILLPGRDELRNFPVNLNIEGPGTYRLFQEFQNLEIQTSGELAFQVFLNGEHVASRKILIRKDDQ